MEAFNWSAALELNHSECSQDGNVFRRLHFDLRYLFHPPWDTGISPPELLAYIETHQPGRALDLGCGSGTNVLTLAHHGWQVTGVDFSPRAIRMARGRIRRAGVSATLLSADLTHRIDLHGPFDLALDIGCFHAVGDRGRYLANLTSNLLSGGHWLLYAFVQSKDFRFGLDSGDLALVASCGFRLLNRADGVDSSSRPSSWFLFEKIHTGI